MNTSFSFTNGQHVAAAAFTTHNWEPQWPPASSGPLGKLACAPGQTLPSPLLSLLLSNYGRQAAEGQTAGMQVETSCAWQASGCQQYLPQHHASAHLPMTPGKSIFNCHLQPDTAFRYVTGLRSSIHEPSYMVLPTCKKKTCRTQCKTLETCTSHGNTCILQRTT